jgi:hypothetical protein
LLAIIVEKSMGRAGDKSWRGNKKGHRAALGLELLTTVQPNPTLRDDRYEHAFMNILFSVEELEQILFGDAGVEVLMQKMFNRVLQAEMTEHLGADRQKRSEERTGYRNGLPERVTRIGSTNVSERLV